MNQPHDPLIDRLRLADPLLGQDHARPLDLATLLGAQAPEIASPPKPGRHRRWGRTAVALGVGAMVMAGGAAAARGLLAGPSPQESGVACVETADQMSVIPSLSDSPVQDCITEWKRVGVAVPKDLVMYQPNDMVVHVAPRSLTPSGAKILTAIPAGEVLDREVKAVLEDRFHNVVTGQRCTTAGDARTYLEGALHRMSATGVAIEGEGFGTCVTTEYDAERKVLTLHRSLPPMPFSGRGEAHPEALTPAMEELKTALSQACTPNEVESAIQHYAGDEGIPMEDMVIGRHDGAGGACTRAYLIPSGSIHLEVFRP